MLIQTYKVFIILIRIHLRNDKLSKRIERRSRPEVFCKKGVLRNVAKACNFIKKESLAQVFSCEFCEIFENPFFYRTPHVAASGSS